MDLEEEPEKIFLVFYITSFLCLTIAVLGWGSLLIDEFVLISILIFIITLSIKSPTIEKSYQVLINF